MIPLRRKQLLAPAVYELHRDALRPRILEEKRARRVFLDDRLTFSFENAYTVLYQVQEMARVEGLTQQEQLLEELRTYNALFSSAGGLSCTLLLQIPDPARRLLEMPGLQEAARTAYVRLPSGRAVPGLSRGPEAELSGVHFLEFPTQAVPVSLGVRRPVPLEVRLPASVRAALAQDMQPLPPGASLESLLRPALARTA